MDYGELLWKAQNNNRNASKKQKENEERRKIEDAQRKKDELLALRSLDKKAQRRVQAMLKSTKSANKSVMEDAVDNINTADTVNGFKQCDEDDYGYVSQEASAFYMKLLDKYSKMPTGKPKFQSNKQEIKKLNAPTHRVVPDLQKPTKVEITSEKLEKKTFEDKKETKTTINGLQKQSDSKKCSNNMKKRQNFPPPMNFDQLLQLAQKKQFEPIIFDKSLLKKNEPERLMTQNEKIEFEREHAIRHKRAKLVHNKTNSSDGLQKKEEQKRASTLTCSNVEGEKMKKIKLANRNKS